MKLAIIAVILFANLLATIAAPGPLHARALEQSYVQIYSRGEETPVRRARSALKSTTGTSTTGTGTSNRKDVRFGSPPDGMDIHPEAVRGEGPKVVRKKMKVKQELPSTAGVAPLDDSYPEQTRGYRQGEY